MELNIYVQLIFLCALNIFFTLCGTILNLVVMFSLWKSSQRREKLCYFMIMVLSFVDLFAVLTNHPVIIALSIFWLFERYDILAWFMICVHVSSTFLGFSFLTLLVMNLDRYIATTYPLVHRVSVMKRKLMTIIGILCLLQAISIAISVNDFLISSTTILILFLTIYSPPFLFLNYKLYMITRRVRKNKAKSPKLGSSIVNVRNISCCLLAVACYLILSIPTYVYYALNVIGKSNLTVIRLSALWAKTIVTMNSTSNCLIFYWKNKLLREEGTRVIKKLKTCWH